MIIGAVIVICLILLVLAFLAPRLSSGPQRGVNKTFGAGGNVAGKAPGPLGRWFRKPFDTSNKAANKSASAGRKGREQDPGLDPAAAGAPSGRRPCSGLRARPPPRPRPRPCADRRDRLRRRLARGRAAAGPCPRRDRAARAAVARRCSAAGCPSPAPTCATSPRGPRSTPTRRTSRARRRPSRSSTRPRPRCCGTGRPRRSTRRSSRPGPSTPRTASGAATSTSRARATRLWARTRSRRSRRRSPRGPASAASTDRCSATSRCSTACAAPSRTGFAVDRDIDGVLSGVAVARGFARDGSPPKEAARRLAKALRALSVGVDGRSDAGTAPPEAQEIAGVDSPPMSEIVRQTNVPSDNFDAEMLLEGPRGALRRGRDDERGRRRRPGATRDVRHPSPRRRRLRPLARGPHDAPPGRPAARARAEHRGRPAVRRLAARRRPHGHDAAADARDGRAGPLPDEDRDAARGQRAGRLLPDHGRPHRGVRDADVTVFITRAHGVQDRMTQAIATYGA